MSRKFNTVKNWYTSGIFSKEVAEKMVRNAVVRKWITEEEYKDITGEEY